MKLRGLKWGNWNSKYERKDHEAELLKGYHDNDHFIEKDIYGGDKE